MSSTSEASTIERDIEGYLARHEQKQLVRFVTVGSVDDGKSTLIGRLLHDSHGLYEDQLAAVKKASRASGEEIDFSLFTDGLKAEREQGITIDVAYRYFSTESRKFIIADTPGHVQYTRNMATGASTADIAVILLDARLGVLPQSRRHAYIASLLGIGQLIVAVNKMDIVGYSRSTFDKLVAEFQAFVERLPFAGVHYLPVSAKRGDNVVAPSDAMPWHQGTLLQLLETVPVGGSRVDEPLRYPVQSVIRPHLDYRGFAGQIASGVLRRGESIVVLPSGRTSTVRSIDTYEGTLERAFAPQSITLRLEDEVDVSRGDMIARPGELPRVTRRFEAMLVWLSERAYTEERALLLKQTTRLVPARIERIGHRLDLETLETVSAEALALNDIARVVVRCNRPIFCDAYADNRVTGAFILIDALSNDTVAAGMIEPEEEASESASLSGPAEISEDERRDRLGQRGAVLFVGPDVRVARRLERALFDRGVLALVLPSVELSDQATVEVAVRCASAGLAVIVAGAAEPVESAVRGEFGESRVLRARDISGTEADWVSSLARTSLASGH